MTATQVLTCDRCQAEEAAVRASGWRCVRLHERGQESMAVRDLCSACVNEFFSSFMRHVA
jgi:hypothetical protein